jgi:hypothetical protein
VPLVISLVVVFTVVAVAAVVLIVTKTSPHKAGKSRHFGRG